MKKKKKEKHQNELGMMAHIYNPRHLEGRDWEDHGSRPAWEKN
jgi:hypothetical protein